MITDNNCINCRKKLKRKQRFMDSDGNIYCESCKNDIEEAMQQIPQEVEVEYTI